MALGWGAECYLISVQVFMPDQLSWAKRQLYRQLNLAGNKLFIFRSRSISTISFRLLLDQQAGHRSRASRHRKDLHWSEARGSPVGVGNSHTKILLGWNPDCPHVWLIGSEIARNIWLGHRMFHESVHSSRLTRLINQLEIRLNSGLTWKCDFLTEDLENSTIKCLGNKNENRESSWD